jgi:hypothetical protein
MTRVSDFDLAEGIKDRIPKAIVQKQHRLGCPSVWQGWAGRNSYSGENLQRFCFKNKEIKELDPVSAELASRSGNLVTFQHCNVNIDNFNV